MAKREKTSKAEYFTVRFNPETSALDRDALVIVKRLIDEGFTFKSIVQDAILRADGHTPEMYTRFAAGISLYDIQGLLEGFADEILSEVRKGGFRTAAQSSAVDDDEIDTGEVSPFAARFAKSFLERQKQTRGDE